ncbi:hypothetical protein H4R34_005066, partial [Dimargaris verticillata]
MTTHEHCHLSTIQQCTAASVDIYSLFNTLLIYENFPAATLHTLDGSIALTDFNELEHTEYDLTAIAEVQDAKLVAHLSWNTKRMGQSYVEQLATHWQSTLHQLLSALETEPTIPCIQACSPLSQSDQQHLIGLSTGPANAAIDTTVVKLLATSVERYPHLPAVEYANEQWTYTQFQGNAQAIAAYLLTCDLCAEEPVGILVHRLPMTVAAMLGVLMAGAAFVPIDPEYPVERIEYIVQDCGIRHMLCHPTDRQTANALQSRINISLHDVSVTIDHGLASDFATTMFPSIAPSNLAYIMYTSGSTGRPKGAMIEHHSLATLVQQVTDCTDIRPGGRHLQMLALTFDSALGDIFFALSHGATLVLRQGIAESLRHVESTITTPSLLSMLDPTHYPHLTSITVIGEVLPNQLAKQWLPTCQVINVYGPTECTIIATSHVCTADAAVTIGRPISNYQVYILDANLSLVAMGVVGELYIGGAGVMRGYVNRPDLDQAALVPHPFHTQGHLYKTGDRGRWLASGEIEYVGRSDDQIKVRGRRVEPSEIEAVLCQHPQVAKAAVVVVDSQLVGFVSPVEAPTADVLSLAQRCLPAYMVPVHLLALPMLPLTTSGKADKKHLLCNAQEYIRSLASSARSITAPRNPTEQLVVTAMAQTLMIAADTIDVNDSFFALGGDSLLAIRFVSLCREEGLLVTVADVFQHPAPSTLAEAYSLTKSDYSHAALKAPSVLEPYLLLDLDDKVLDNLQYETACQLNTSVDDVIDILPTSSLQTGFIVNTLKDPSAYMVQASYHLSGPFDVKRYRWCWQQVGQRHSILRTKFVTTDTVPGHSAVQAVLSTVDMAWSYSVCDQLPDDGFDQQFFARDRQHGFAFDGCPLVRIALFQVTDTDHRLFLTLHHALLDAWSMNIVLDEVMALYYDQSLEPVMQYNCYLAHLAQLPMHTTEAFWSELLSGVKPTPDLQLPSVRAPTSEPVAQRYATHQQRLACPLSDINAFCQRLDITVNNLLRGLWALLLSRYLNASDEVTFGVMVSGRSVPLPGIDDMAGLCINTVPFRAKLDHHQLLHDWLRHLHHISGSIMAYEHASLVDIQRWANVAAGTPLFQSLLVFDKYRDSLLNPDDHQVQCHEAGGLNFTEYTLTATFAMNKNSLQLSLEHDTAKYDPAYMALLGNFISHCLTRAIQSSADTTLTEAMQLPLPELETITAWSQGTTAIYDPECTRLHDVFLRNLTTRAAAVALESNGQQWTYAQVHCNACKVAHWLLSQDFKPGHPVALVFTRSPEYVFAVLAVLLAGGIYVPIDANVSTKRIGDILDDLNSPLILSGSSHVEVLRELERDFNRVGLCDEILQTTGENDLMPSFARPSCDALAYIIYTSGTTGKPKGAMIRHESVVNMLHHIASAMKLSDTTRCLQVLNIAFDVCIVEVFATFLVGGTVVLSMSELLHDLSIVNTCHLTCSLLSAIEPKDYPNLAIVANVGEPLKPSIGKQWCQGRAFYNCYGPTETSVTSHMAVYDSALTVHVGVPFPNTQTYIVDDRLQLVPTGVPGQVCIAGIGVGNGYWKRPDLTAKAFVANPFGPGKLYLTGDVGCWLPNGGIKLYGRRDHQVKLRGFRIELSELETVAQAIDMVSACAAIVKDGQLVLYASPLSVNDSGVCATLTEKLPSYMHPEYIITVDQLPLTTNGKIDRRALEALPLPEVTLNKVADPSTFSPEFRILRDTLAEVLAIDPDRIQPTSSFFRLGGDSISAIQLVARCKRRGVTITVAQVLKRPILAQLEQHAELLSDVPVTESAVTHDPVGPLPLTAIQRWFLYDRGHDNMDHFNQSFALKCREPLT